MQGDREIAYWMPRSMGRRAGSAALGELLTIGPTRPLFARLAERISARPRYSGPRGVR